MSAGLAVIVPANDEEAWLGACLDALAAQELDPGALGGARVVVSANACTDATVAVAEAARPALETAGWDLTVIDDPAPGKAGALNRAEAAPGVSEAGVLAYLDADVTCEPALMGQLHAALMGSEPLYGSGTLTVAPPRSWATRHYARIWTQLPFMTQTVPGAGLFAVNRAGRARWGAFPEIISDDGFVRLCFAPHERRRVPARYHWPLVEGLGALIRVRRRQDAGIRQIEALHPHLTANEDKAPLGAAGHLALLRRAPLSYLVYVAILMRVRLGGTGGTAWTRGR